MSYDQWTTECPKCHNRDCLTVFQVTLAMTGETIYPESRLQPDGFVVDPAGEFEHLKDQSTTDEKVRCDTCGQVFELSDLFIPEPFAEGPKLDPAIEAHNRGVDPFVCDYCGRWTEEDEVHEPDCPKHEPFSVRIIWGSDPRTPCEYKFRTKAELDAFTNGINEAFGEESIKVVDQDGKEVV